MFDETEALMLSVKFSVAALIMATGMGAKFSDISYLWRRPQLLLQSLLAMYVVVPVAALVIVRVLPLNSNIKIALLVLAVSAGAPLLPRRLQHFGSNAYTFSLLIISSLLAVFVVPTWLALLKSYFNLSAEFSIIDVAAVIAKTFLLPLVVGMTIATIFPTAYKLIASKLWAIAWIIFIFSVLALLVLNWQFLLQIRGPGIAALVILMIVAAIVGHTLGGPNPETRTTLAIACCTRHLGVAVVVATALRDPPAVILLAAYIFCSALVSIPYLRWQQKTATVR
jgi:BASS family bile acid:Na+ symporter